jgi:hypothetical protein
VLGAQRPGQRVPSTAPHDPCGHQPLRRSVTSTKLIDAKTGPVLPSVTIVHDRLGLATSAFPLVIAVSGVDSYQETSMYRENFTTVSVGGTMTAPR